MTFNIRNQVFVAHWFWQPRVWTYWRWWRTLNGAGGLISMIDLGPIKAYVIWDSLATKAYVKRQYGLG